MTKTALITGITGQDGSYLAELLAMMVDADIKRHERRRADAAFAAA